MENASKARRTSCIRAMVKPKKSSLTELLDTLIYSSVLLYQLCSWRSAQPCNRCVAGHLSRFVLSIYIHCYRLSQSLDGLWELKKGSFGIRQYSFLLSDTGSVKNMPLCPVSKFDIFIKSGSPIVPHIKSADSYKVELGQLSPSKSCPIPS